MCRRRSHPPRVRRSRRPVRWYPTAAADRPAPSGQVLWLTLYRPPSTSATPTRIQPAAPRARRQRRRGGVGGVVSGAVDDVSAAMTGFNRPRRPAPPPGRAARSMTCAESSVRYDGEVNALAMSSGAFDPIARRCTSLSGGERGAGTTSAARTRAARAARPQPREQLAPRRRLGLDAGSAPAAPRRSARRSCDHARRGADVEKRDRGCASGRPRRRAGPSSRPSRPGASNAA